MREQYTVAAGVDVAIPRARPVGAHGAEAEERGARETNATVLQRRGGSTVTHRQRRRKGNDAVAEQQRRVRRSGGTEDSPPWGRGGLGSRRPAWLRSRGGRAAWWCRSRGIGSRTTRCR